jgi:hypothetical protein
MNTTNMTFHKNKVQIIITYISLKINNMEKFYKSNFTVLLIIIFLPYMNF